jgi:predicted transcriptional regulator
MSDAVPTDRELEALKVLWDRPQATVREICDAINARGEELAYTTVLSLLQVMEQKGLVGHKSAGKAYTYFARRPRDATFRQMASQFLDRVFDGAMDQYLVHALNSRKLKPDEIERLERMLAEAKKSPKSTTPKGERR